MTSFRDMLDPADRRRLERLAEPEHEQDLAAGARDAARESSGAGRTAWLVVAMALTLADGSAESARRLIDALVHDDRVRHLAQACLTTLTSDDDPTETP
jgi:hypothetical protein